jgi:hypothetical protein
VEGEFDGAEGAHADLFDEAELADRLEIAVRLDSQSHRKR